MSVQKAGWSGLKNGDLLTKAQWDFDVFITGDRNLRPQQHLPKYNIAIIVLHSKTTQLNECHALMPFVREAVVELRPGQIMIIG